MKKILFLVTRLYVGGLENYLLRFLSYKDHDFDATVLSKSGQKGMLDRDYLEREIRVTLLRLGYFSLLDYWKFYRYIRNAEFDTVCDFTGEFSGIVLLVSRLAKINKRLVFYRNSDYRFPKTYLRKLYARAMIAFIRLSATKILSNSKAALEKFHPTNEQKPDFYHVIDNGIPEYNKISIQQYEMIRKTLGIPLDAFLIGHVGRYDDQKNHKQILAVAEILIKRFDNVYFFLCGREVKDNLKSYIKQSNFDKRILLDNSRSDVWDLLQVFDAFYFPSTIEGQPNALLEAMSVGLPFVSSDISAIKECVPQEFHKYLVPPNDSESAVALLSTFIEKTYKDDFYKVKAYVKDRYNATANFDKFLKQL